MPLTILIVAADRGLRALMRSDSALAYANGCGARIIILTFARGDASEAGVVARLFSAGS
jgi:hypothetical protein